MQDTSWSVQLNEATVDLVIKAVCILHNYVLDYNSPNMEVET